MHRSMELKHSQDFPFIQQPGRLSLAVARVSRKSYSGQQETQPSRNNKEKTETLADFPMDCVSSIRVGHHHGSSSSVALRLAGTAKEG